MAVVILILGLDSCIDSDDVGNSWKSDIKCYENFFIVYNTVVATDNNDNNSMKTLLWLSEGWLR